MKFTSKDTKSKNLSHFSSVFIFNFEHVFSCLDITARWTAETTLENQFTSF